MNHITALAIAKGINHDRLEAAERRRSAGRPAEAARPQRRSPFVDVASAYLVAFRGRAAGPQPAR